MFALTHHNLEDNSRDGVSLVAVSDDPLKLEERAAELETERIREELEQATFDQLSPVAELHWSDWGMPGRTWSVAEVPWGQYHIEDVDAI